MALWNLQGREMRLELIRGYTWFLLPTLMFDEWDHEVGIGWGKWYLWLGRGENGR